MKRIKKLAALMVAAMMALAMSITAFAQTVALEPADEDNATITINNAAKDETYSIYKLFDATVNGDKIAYQCTGDIPAGLEAFFSKDKSNNVIPADSICEKDGTGKITGTIMTDGLKAALEDWAKTAKLTSTAVSDGSALSFTGLPYGYYVMTTSHIDQESAKAAITVTSTQPDVTINDKNVNEPGVQKEVEKESYSIGDTVKYTATFNTTNYMDENGTPRQVVEYLISDTLPEFLSGVKVTSITIDGEPHLVEGKVPQFEDKKITIPWATGSAGNYTSLYKQGAKIVMEYEAVLTSVTNINKDDINEVSIRPYVDRGNDKPELWEKPWTDQAKIITYAAAIKKVDEEGNALAGATFTIKGLVVEAVTGEKGVYKVVSYNSAEDAAESAELSTDENGKLYIVGLAKDVNLTVTEFKAPNGYNKLTESVKLTPQVLSEEIFETSGTKYYDAYGNLVKEEASSTTSKTVEQNLSDLDEYALEIVNNEGSLLPSTGGIGTTIFYIVGAVLVIGAGVILVAKKRMSKEV